MILIVLLLNNKETFFLNSILPRILPIVNKNNLLISNLKNIY